MSNHANIDQENNQTATIWGVKKNSNSYNPNSGNTSTWNSGDGSFNSGNQNGNSVDVDLKFGGKH